MRSLAQNQQKHCFLTDYRVEPTTIVSRCWIPSFLTRTGTRDNNAMSHRAGLGGNAAP